jgi:hypothetical protein
MKSDLIADIVPAIAALHVTVLSVVFGLRHVGYLLTATLSATVLWGVVFFLSGRERGAGILAGAALAVVVQQAAYQVWKTQLPGFWRPLAQFAALQLLVAYGVSRAAT